MKLQCICQHHLIHQSQMNYPHLLLHLLVDSRLILLLNLYLLLHHFHRPEKNHHLRLWYPQHHLLLLRRQEHYFLLHRQ